MQAQRVLVVDEQEIAQEGLSSILTQQSWVAGCLVASTAETAWLIARRQHPQLVVVSSTLADGAAFVLCREFREHMPHMRVVLAADGRMSAAAARLHGAVGYISKQMPASAIADVIRRIAAGDQAFPRAVQVEVGLRLTARQHDVLTRVAAGCSNAEVATALCLSRHTIKQCVSELYRKLDVRNRAEAASRARELGLLS
jgi:DNA-binding NarL/FixJ family response regulator